MRVISPIILIGLTILITNDSKSYFINNNIQESKNFNTRNLDNDFIENYAIDIPTSTIKNNLTNSFNNDNKDKEHINNIYKFLLAEIAIAREETLIASKNLTELLKITQDPQIAEILTQFAIQTDDYKLTAFASREWAKIDVDNWQAQLIATLILLEEDPTAVEKFIEQAIKITPSNIDLKLANLLNQLPIDKQGLLEKRLISIVNKDPNNSLKQLCLAQVAVQNNNINIAKKAVQIALKNSPNLTNAILLQTKLIKHETHSYEKALDYLFNQINKFPKKEELVIFYANVLFDYNKNIEAIKALEPLTYSKNLDNFLEANLLMSEIYMQKPTLNIKKAKNYLNKLMHNNLLGNGKVYFMLGEIAEQELNIEQAIKYYTLVEDPPYQVIGFLRSALLLADNQQYDQALELLKQVETSNILEEKQLLLLQIEFAIELQDLTQALKIVKQGLTMMPNDIDFLYTASIIYSLNKQFNLAEECLKTIIKFEPENHIALNALGFMLTINLDNAHNQHKLKEALNYLELALRISPNNPIYMDNLGMLLYRMGKVPDSLKILTSAYNISEDANIAIHLGELLWVSGKHQQATKVWEKAWQANPNDLELINILNQYKIFFVKNN